MFKFSSYGITADQIVWNYTTDGNDFINVTGKDITVVGTLEGTYDINSTAYGYAFTSKSATYQISKKTLTSSNVEMNSRKQPFHLLMVLMSWKNEHYIKCCYG